MTYLCFRFFSGPIDSDTQLFLRFLEKVETPTTLLLQIHFSIRCDISAFSFFYSHDIAFSLRKFYNCVIRPPKNHLNSFLFQ